MGFRHFYDAWSDYLPGYIYVLWFLAKLEPVLGISQTLLYKLPAIMADLAAGLLIYKVVSRKNQKLGLIASFLFLFNPAVLANSTLWGQVDMLTSLTSLVSVATLNYWPISAVSLALGVAVKPQALMAAPVVAAIMLSDKWGVKKILKYALVGLITLLAVFAPLNNTGNIFSFFESRLTATLNQYPYNSVNAFNFWGLWGFWKGDSFGLISPKNMGVIVMGIVGVLALTKNKLVSGKRYHFLAIFLLANFMFFTRMHERHLLPALAPLAIASSFSPVLWVAYAGLSATYLLNLHYSFVWITKDFAEVFPPQMIAIFIIANLVMFFGIVKNTFSEKKIKLSKKVLNAAKKFKLGKLPKVEDRLTSRQARIALGVILAFSLLVRVVNLGTPAKDYFDEIYHAFTARQMLIFNPKPWDWMSKPPEGFAYEWTHPPLGKEIMAESMRIFGVSSFAWRLPGALLGVVIVLCVYLIAKKLSKSYDVAVISALLISLDGLVLTMSRIGTADVYFLALALVSYYFFLDKRDFFSAVFLGFAAAAKWSTIWFLPVFAVTWLIWRRKFTRSLIWFFVLPPLIYVFSYLPMFSFGWDLKHLWGMQEQMWWYHSRLKATHPYSSLWWTWPLMERPVYLYQDFHDGIIANIYAIGNPFFFWAGALSVLWSIWIFIRKRFAALAILIFGYLVTFAPWAASPRIMFLYHYLPALPFMAIILAYMLRKNKYLIFPVILAIFVCFIYFYPHWTAIPVSTHWDDTYYWFTSWR